MPGRTAKFVSAIIASIVAGVPLTTTSHGGTVAADNCLSGPKGQTPPGSHWYYRVDHASKRHCWYLREEGEKVSQAAPQQISPQEAIPQKASPPAQPAAPQTDAGRLRSVADARAELPPQTDAAPSIPWPAIARASNDAPQADAGTIAPSTLVASRWPEPLGVSPVSSPRPATSDLAANAPANPTAAPKPAAVAVTIAADDPSQGRSYSISKLFVAIIGALALGSMTASLISRFGAARYRRPGAIRARRGPMWERTDDDRIVLSDYPVADVVPRRRRFSQGLADAGEPDDRVAEFLSRIPGRSLR